MQQEFWKRAQIGSPDACWEWQASRLQGYGVFNLRRKGERAHRVAWELTHGPIPEGLSVCHRCDNPPCVNPAHLFLGTQADNIADRHRKGRSRGVPGERHHKAKLTEADVLSIRQLYPYCSISEISREFGVRRATVYAIVHRQTWKHLGSANAVISS